MTGRTHVVVIGGGYAGVMAANRVTRNRDVAVTLVNARPVFVERIRLHQLVAGSDDAVVDYRGLLGERVRLVVGTVDRIDAAERRVVLRAGEPLDYDYLIYAVGSGSADPAVPGAAGFAYPIAVLEQAERLRVAVGDLSASAPIAVVGAGPTGIETAAELAERGRPVTLVCGDELGPYLHPRGRRLLAARLAKLGVTVLQGEGARVTEVTRDAVRLGDGRLVDSAVTVWTAGFDAPDLARRSGLATDTAGRLLTDETLTSVDDERIVAAGDSAAPSGVPFRMSCQAAGPLGIHAAQTVLDRIAGTSPSSVALGFLGECLSLGRQAGMFQFSRKDDTAVAFTIGGRLGAWVKAFVCWGTVQQLVLEARRPGLYVIPGWTKDHSRRRKLEAARHDVLAS